MTNTSSRPFTVDAVRLDTLAWNITKIARATPARRPGDYQAPGIDGAVPSLEDPLDMAYFGLDMWIRGTDANGAVPGAGMLDTMRANLDELLHLFGKRYALLDLQEQVTATDTRRAWAKVSDVIAPDLDATGTSGLFTVGFVLPYGVWEDLATSDFSVAASGGSVASAEVTTLRGATEQVGDSTILVTGPATSPRVTDPVTGQYIELGGTALPSGSKWRVNCQTWASRVGTTLTLGSSDISGTDRTADTIVGGPSRGSLLTLTPARDTGLRRVRLSLSAASGVVNGTTALGVRAKRKYAA